MNTHTHKHAHSPGGKGEKVSINYIDCVESTQHVFSLKEKDRTIFLPSDVIIGKNTRKNRKRKKPSPHHRT
jgi:hypothetical protein